MAKVDNHAADGSSPLSWNTLAEQARFQARRLAELKGISRRQLERLFLSEFGKPPQQWLDEIRLMKAAIGLAQGKRVKEVAWEFGYCEASVFSRRFKEFFGSCPSAFADFVLKQDRLRAKSFDENCADLPRERSDVFPFGHAYLLWHALPKSAFGSRRKWHPA